MDKELKEMLKNINNTMDKLIKDKGINTKLEKAVNSPCSISIEKDNNGGAKVKIEGNRLSLLIALAGLEKIIFDKLNCDSDEFEMIKTIVGTMEAEDNE